MGKVRGRPVPATRPKTGRMVHGTYKTARVMRCPCMRCETYRERPAGASNDPDYVDEVAVERVAAGGGYPELLTIAEREAVVRLLYDQWMTDVGIAHRTGMSSFSVFGIRKRLGLPHRYVQ